MEKINIKTPIENKIENVKFVTTENWFEYDSHNNKIHEKTPNVEKWYTYNDKDKLIFYKDSTGITETYSYNNFGEMIQCIRNDDIIYRAEYGENNNMTYLVQNGIITRYNYDSEGRLLCSQNETDMELYMYDDKEKMVISFKNGKFSSMKVYNSHGNCTHFVNNNKFEKKCFFDKDNNLIYMKDSYGNNYTYKYHNGKLMSSMINGINYSYHYDHIGKISYITSSEGFIEKHTYNHIFHDIINSNNETYQFDCNNNILYKCVNGVETNYFYNKHGKLLSNIDSFGNEIYNDYDDNDNLIHSKFTFAVPDVE